MTSAGNKLKPCPFCGAVPIVYDDSGDLRINHAANCYLTLGHASTRWIVGNIGKAAWNRRSGERDGE